MDQLTNVQAINRFFDDPDNGSPKPTMAEHKALSKEERTDLGALCAVELGVEIKSVA